MIYTPPPRDPKAAPVRINLLSDTQTRPAPAMREAIARAEGGDAVVLPARRRNSGTRARAYDRPRRRRARGAWRIPDHAAAGRRRTIHARHFSWGTPPAQPLPAAADRRQRGADRQYRRRHDLAEGASPPGPTNRKIQWACHPHGRRAAV